MFPLHNRALFLTLILALLPGCYTTVAPIARQLDAGEIGVAAALSAPGTSGIARLSGQAVYGVGGAGDVGVSLGTEIFTINAGLQGRWYPRDWFAVGMDVDLMRYPLVDPGLFVDLASEERFWLFSGRFRVGTTPRQGEVLYGGLQAEGFNNLDRDGWVGAAGLYAGITRPAGGSQDLQFEVSFSPLLMSGNRIAFFDPNVPFFAQLDGAWIWRF